MSTLLKCTRILKAETSGVFQTSGLDERERGGGECGAFAHVNHCWKSHVKPINAARCGAVPCKVRRVPCCAFSALSIWAWRRRGGAERAVQARAAGLILGAMKQPNPCCCKHAHAPSFEKEPQALNKTCLLRTLYLCGIDSIDSIDGCACSLAEVQIFHWCGCEVALVSCLLGNDDKMLRGRILLSPSSGNKWQWRPVAIKPCAIKYVHTCVCM